MFSTSSFMLMVLVVLAVVSTTSAKISFGSSVANVFKTKESKETKGDGLRNLFNGLRGGAKSDTITKSQIEEAQKAWGNGIVKISAAHSNGEDFEKMARDHISTLYSYGYSPVLFKPTLAAKKQFRKTYNEAVSYFVATNKVCAEDTGFAIKGWKKVRWENHDIVTVGKQGLAMGNYYFTKPDGSEAKVEYSFGYILDDKGKARINLHHSSMPYAP
jgi:hypothetical protein